MATRLKTLETKWLSACDSVEADVEKLIVEQLLDILPSDLCIWLCERKPTTEEQTAALSDDYTLAHHRKRMEASKHMVHEKEGLEHEA